MRDHHIHDQWTISEIDNGFILHEECGPVISSENIRFFPTYEEAAWEIIRLIEEALAEMKGGEAE